MLFVSLVPCVTRQPLRAHHFVRFMYFLFLYSSLLVVVQCNGLTINYEMTFRVLTYCSIRDNIPVIQRSFCFYCTPLTKLPLGNFTVSLYYNLFFTNKFMIFFVILFSYDLSVFPIWLDRTQSLFQSHFLLVKHTAVYHSGMCAHSKLLSYNSFFFFNDHSSQWNLLQLYKCPLLLLYFTKCTDLLLMSLWIPTECILNNFCIGLTAATIN